MKQLIILIMLFGLFSCKNKNQDFSENENKLIDSIGFEKYILIELKQYVNVSFSQYETSEPGYFMEKEGKQLEKYVEKQNGISFQFPDIKVDDVVLKFKDKLKQKGYLIFISQKEFDSLSTISIIKTTDYFEILRIQKTDGTNYEIDNDGVIEKLKDWDKRYGIEIIGADYDWVELLIKQPVDDVPKFANEVYEFCPDIVEQGVGDIKELEKIIKNDKRLFLWWD